MFHAEGYVDRHTYVAAEHMVNVTVQYQGRVCYVWMVSKQILCEEKAENIKNVLEGWAGNELVKVLSAGQVAIQRELQRFGNSAAGCTALILCVYYMEHIFVMGEGKGAYKSFRKPMGIYLSEELVTALGGKDDVEKAVCGKSLEEKAHCLKKMLLCLCSRKKLPQGYFMLWEDETDV